LSFTVKAAAELRDRVGELLRRGEGAGADKSARSGVVAATFHSFCCSLLREHAADAGISPDFGITSDTRKEDILRELRKTGGGKNGPTAKKLGNYIEERKRFLLLPGRREQRAAAAIINFTGDMFPVPEPDREMEILYTQYRDRLSRAGLLDYEDLIAGTVRLLGAKESILAEYRKRFRYIFVDEYQDINLSQYILLRLLADGVTAGAGGCPWPSLWVIGDPNQAIYGFRGSDKRFIDRFISDYPDARRFELARSFRCADPIISAAGRLTGSGLRGTERPVDLCRCEYATDKAEAEGVARAISRLIGGATFFAKDSDDAGPGTSDYADTAAPGDCAVLIRAAPLADAVVKALNDHGIPFELTGEQRWWDEEPFKSFLDQTRASAAPEDAFQKGKQNPALKRLFELAALFGNVRSLLDALACSGPGGFPEFNREGVKIMTIHASKGLEFDHVFVIGLEDGILPFTLYDDAGALRLEEERRLLYVAMTRARVGLYLSWAHSRIFKGRKLNGKPSPFLDELEKIIPLAESKKSVKKDSQLKLF
jgi:superfamily I DNA/RNA helicase